MRKILFVLGVMALLAGTAFAEGRFVIDDAGFDYFGGDDGYVSIDFSDGVFTLSFSDSAGSDANLAVNDIEFLPLDDTVDFSQASMRRYLPFKIDTNSVEVTYTDVSLDAVVASYDEQLTGLGFSSSVDQTYANQTVMVYEQGDTITRVVFTRQGKNVKVSMSV